MAGSETIHVNLAGDVRAALYPRVPIRLMLRRAHRHALGFTDDDLAAMAKSEEGDEPVTATHDPDPHAAMMVCCAVVGICAKLPVSPTFRECRHDAVQYGELVYEHLFSLGKPAVLRSARDEGARLLRAMYEDAFEGLFAEVAAAEDPTAARAETSTLPSPASG